LPVTTPACTALSISPTTISAGYWSERCLEGSTNYDAAAEKHRNVYLVMPGHSRSALRRLCRLVDAGHPRPFVLQGIKTWMAGTSPAMTTTKT
jgi:hypothetical protein